MTAPTFGIFDADNHYYEPRDTFRPWRIAR
jgi:hypothetical protein